jgi:hypothetical protein
VRAWVLRCQGATLDECFDVTLGFIMPSPDNGHVWCFSGLW